MPEGSEPPVLPLELPSPIAAKQARYRSEINQLFTADRAAHNWYRFALFPASSGTRPSPTVWHQCRSSGVRPVLRYGHNRSGMQKFGDTQRGGGGKPDGAVCGSGQSRLECRSRSPELYFGGMARHLADLRQILRPGAQLA